MSWDGSDPMTDPGFEWLKKPRVNGETLMDGNGMALLTPGEMLQQVEAMIRKYLILPKETYLPLACWVIATHAAALFECFPYIAVVSATKRCGKTRLAEVLETLVRMPWRGTAPSPAAIYRYLEQARTLLLDETEILNGKNKSEMTTIMLAVINAGYRKGATVLRCDGGNHVPREFPVYGPKMLAAIGKLPDTIMDRCLVIQMRRRKKDEPVGRFMTLLVKRETQPLRAAIVDLIPQIAPAIEKAYEDVVQQGLDFLSDRDCDLWCPLFAICHIFDRKRMGEMLLAAEKLCGSKIEDDEDENYALTLLKDIRTVWPEGTEKYETSLLIDRLKALEESPWSEHQLTPRKIARMLRAFGIVPRKLRVGERTARGYVFEELQDAFTRYLVDLSGTCGTDQ